MLVLKHLRGGVFKRFRQVSVIFFRFLRSPASLLRHFLHVTSAEIPASRLQTPVCAAVVSLCPFPALLIPHRWQRTRKTQRSTPRTSRQLCACSLEATRKTVLIRW